MFLIVYYLIAIALAAKCTVEANTANCDGDNCDTVGGTEICKQCKPTFVPINGKCTAKATSSSDITAAGCKKANADEADQTCGKCGANYFLYKGGCYKKGQDPGQAICKDTADTTAGVCDECQAGYFKNPVTGLDATKQSCIACNDETGANDNTGVANCATCDPPKKSGQSGSPQKATCTACADGYYGADCTNSCDKSCKSCTGAEATTCTSCKDPSPYFKKGTGETGECVEKASCKGNYFPNDEVDGKKQCIPCGDSAHGGIADCGECSLLTPASRSSTVLVTCTKCGNSKYLKTAADGTITCVEKTACKGGFFPVDDSSKGNKCVSCGDETGVTDASNAKWNGVANCTKCTQPSTAGTATCEECASGDTLDSQANTCVPASANRSGLSTGAIAGISVAAVVVVGGLVGFLCWWFVCRGKA